LTGDGTVRGDFGDRSCEAKPCVKLARASGGRSNRVHAQKALLEYLMCGRATP
jgi:hypothetical protein